MLLMNVNSTPDAAPPGTMGLVNVLAALCVVPLSSLFDPPGVRPGSLIPPIPPLTLQGLFAVVLFFISIRILYSRIFD